MSTPKRLVILGSGESGTGAALLGKRLGFDVFVSDKGAIKDQFRAELENAGIPYESGAHDLDRLLQADLVVKSPGIPGDAPVVQALTGKNIPVIGEIELAYRYAGKCTLIAITGSNGKTTTTELTWHLLHTAGLNARKAGNVGLSFARLVADDLENDATSDASRVFVLETSSFQLDDIDRFRPDIAVLLNITPDHLDRYGYELERYAAAKFRIIRNQRTGDVFLYNAFDPVTGDFLSRHPLNPDVTNTGIRRGFDQGNTLRIDAETTFDLAASAILGPHNKFNAVCAVRVAMLCGAAPEAIQKGLNTFVPPPHRLEKVAEVNGVVYINDSKATNVDSVYYALQAMETPTIWIAGGQDKGNDYTPLMPLVQEKVRAIVCLGADNSKLIREFGPLKKPLVETSSATAAVETASKLAQPGDSVLLSPACASFDLFQNYEHRGRLFREAVLELKTHLSSPTP